MFLIRLMIGILKGAVIGALVGTGLAHLGLAVLPAIVAYISAGVVGACVGLIAGKPIWSENAKIEAGMKAFFGIFLGIGVMFAIRQWMPWEFPVLLPDSQWLDPYKLAPGNKLSQLSLVSLVMVSGLIGAFYEVDNTSEKEKSSPKSNVNPRTPKRKSEEALLLEEDDLQEKKMKRKN